MTIAAPRIEAELLTYESYMAEDPVYRRYDIINGERIFMTNPSVRHQETTLSIAVLLRAYQIRTHRGRTVIAPSDVLISRKPLRSRQPDVLFISRERYGNRLPADPSPLSPAPELVIEVLSPSESRGMRMTKIADYCKVNVIECWLVSAEAETVEVLRLSPAGTETIDIHGHDTTVTSIAFPDLSIPVADIFALNE